MGLPYLPADLVEEKILSRVPAISLRRLRFTCKRWNSLFKDPVFRERHLRSAPKHHGCVFMLKEHRIFPLSVDLNVVPPSIEFEDPLNLRDSNSEQVDIARVFHCDGLLLCITRDKRPVVWNPFLRESRWIQRKGGYARDCTFALGYEDKQSCRSYKILMFREWESDGFEIYEFSSDSWRVVDALFCKGFSGVCLKGNTYWISHSYNHLLKFDFTREQFGFWKLHPSLGPGTFSKDLSVVGEEKLAMFINRCRSSKVEMWVTNKIGTGAKLSWSNAFAVDLPSSCVIANCFYVSTSLLIDEEKKVALCCNSRYTSSRNKNMVFTIGEDDEYYTEVPYTKDPSLLRRSGRESTFIFNYVPSFVQIQSK